MSKGLKWEVMRSRLRSCTATFLGGLVVCMSLFREDLSMSFFLIFVLYAFSDFLSNSWLFQTKKEIPSR